MAEKVAFDTAKGAAYPVRKKVAKAHCRGVVSLSAAGIPPVYLHGLESSGNFRFRWLRYGLLLLRLCLC